MRRSLALLTWLVVLAAWPQAAVADAADDYFKQGLELGKASKIPEAEEAFEKAWALRKAWDIAGNLGLMEAEQGKWTEAAEHLHYAMTHIGSLASEEHKAGLKQRHDNVVARVAKISIQTDAAGVSVKVGTRTLTASDPIFLTEGAHQLECSAEGYESIVIDLVTTRGQVVDVKVELKKKGDKSDPGPGGVEPKPAWPAILLGVGGGIFIVGGIGSLAGGLVVRGGVEEETMTGQCSTDPACADHESSLDTANTLAALGIVGLGIGSAALVGMGVYLAVGDDREPNRVGLTLGAGSVRLEGSF